MVQKLEEQKTEDVDQKWQHTCDWVVKAVVSVQAYVARGFDTEKAGSYDATGFIVNAKEGIILTNRVRFQNTACNLTLIRSSM